MSQVLGRGLKGEGPAVGDRWVSGVSGGGADTSGLVQFALVRCWWCFFWRTRLRRWRKHMRIWLRCGCWVTKWLPVYVTGALGSPRLSRSRRNSYCYFHKDGRSPHLRSAFPHAYQGYACVSCVPGSPRYPHPLTRLCVWRLPPARLLVDPGVPGSTFHTPPRAGCSR